MFLAKKMVNCWRYGELRPRFQRLLYVGWLVLVILPLFLFGDNHLLTQDRLVLIDVLLGLPLILALWLTVAIIWQGMVKTIACLSGGIGYPVDDTAHLSDQQDQLQNQLQDNTHARY